MKNGRLQIKDIPDEPILELLRARPGTWFTWFPSRPEEDEIMPTVVSAFPAGLPDKLVLAKMNSLIRRGLIEGCACGCRGDFEITEKGKKNDD